MAFKWKNIQPDEVPLIEEAVPSEVEELVIFGRLQHNKEVVGCCGLVRKDTIYPVGPYPNFGQFKREAISMMEEYETYEDTYSIEQYYGMPGQNFREDGESVYLLQFEGGVWWFYYSNELAYSGKTIEDFSELWEI